MKRYLKVLFILIPIVIISGIFAKEYLYKNKNEMIGIIKKDLYDGKTEFLGSYSKNKENSKFAGYIIGENLKENKKIREDFKTNKLLILSMELKIPDFMQYFSPVIVDNAINLVPTKNDIGNKYSKNSLSLDEIDNKIKTLEEYLKIEQSSSGSDDKETRKTIKSYKIDKDSLIINYDGNTKNVGDKSPNTKFKEYAYIKLKNNKLYKISYCFQNEKVGNKVIKLINDTFKIK